VSTLALCDISKHYAGARETVRAVDGVTLSVASGEFVAVYGPSGAGKTTLLLLAAAVLAPDSGKVLFDELDVSTLSDRDRARYRRESVGFIFQAFHLMGSMSALDNSTIKLAGGGLTVREARVKARAWLERVGLSERMDHKPEELSMGERQRVAVARALVNEPGLLLADEPTGNLDSERTRKILALLRDVCHERQVPALLVTHDPEAMAFVDRAYILRDGRLSEELDAGLAVAL
jgi:putative ABC transport system ATP-binding protein